LVLVPDAREITRECVAKESTRTRRIPM